MVLRPEYRGEIREDEGKNGIKQAETGKGKRGEAEYSSFSFRLFFSYKASAYAFISPFKPVSKRL